MSLVIKVETPDHDNVLRMIHSAEITPEKLKLIAQNVSLSVESEMKQIIIQDTKEPTGQTAASIETWTLFESPQTIVHAIGSRTRGAILMWLDRGRGWVYPVSRRALRFLIKGEKVFSMFSRPSPALNILFRAASRAWSDIDMKIKEVLGR